MPTTLGALARAAAAAARAAGAGGLAPLDAQAARAAALIAGGDWTRARADHAALESGMDGLDDEADTGMAVLVRLAAAVGAGWAGLDAALARARPDASGGAPEDGFERAARWFDARADDATRADARPAEGFAHYAVFPEAVWDAARAWGPDTAVVGVRGIGTALAAVAAAACGARAVVTVRPVGHPFAREVRAAAAVAARVRGAARVLVVDEGPGLSGSSMAAVARWLEAAGVAAGRITLMTTHGGPPGAAASDGIRAVWARCGRAVAALDPGARVAAWSGALLGETVTRCEWIGGGAWAAAGEPVDPARERLKWRVTTRSGRYGVRFAGLGAVGAAKLARARALGAFVPAPSGLAHGLLVERWVERASGAPPTFDEVAAYLRARRALAAPNGGADVRALAAMAKANVGEALGPALAARAGARLADINSGTPAAVDGRMHAWEWVRAHDGRLLKCDAVDHCAGHDLIGCQDIAWDVAGAAVELGLDPAALGGAAGANPALVAAHGLAYPAFQLGLWTLAAHPRARVYADVLRRALA